MSLSSFLSDINNILASLTVLFPGIVAYFIYIGIRSTEFERIKRGHILLILVFTLFFQIIRNIFGDFTQNPLEGILYFFILPIVVGVFSDLVHRFFVTVAVEKYQGYIIDNVKIFKLKDVGNVSRWQKTINSSVSQSTGDYTKNYYAEVEVQTSNGSILKKGFLNGYSENDIELTRYEKLSEKDFTGIGDPDINKDQLTYKIEIIPKEKIISVNIYRVRMEDFNLK